MEVVAVAVAAAGIAAVEVAAPAVAVVVAVVERAVIVGEVAAAGEPWSARLELDVVAAVAVAAFQV